MARTSESCENSIKESDLGRLRQLGALFAAVGFSALSSSGQELPFFQGHTFLGVEASDPVALGMAGGVVEPQKPVTKKHKRNPT